jgi:hypothetical protein
MPRLRAVRTKEEAELVPPTEAIEVIMAPEGETPVERQEPEKVTPKPEPEPIESDTDGLKAQLEQAKKAERLVQEQLAAAHAREQNLTRERDETRVESTQHQFQAEEARYTAVVNALGAATSEADAAQQAWEMADTTNDTKTKAEAQRRLARAEANIARYEEAKDTLESRRELRRTEPPARTQPTPAANPVETAIAAMPPGAQTWLRGHPEFITDARRNAKLQAAHWDALDEGHPQFSTPYFESLEQHLGLRTAARTDPEEPPAPPTRSRTVPSAPPSRDTQSTTTGKPASPNRVNLTPEEREIARLAGIDDVTYARGVLERDRRKGMGMYQERG